MTKNTYAFYLQSAISFGAAFLFMVGGIYFLPADGWVRAFLCLGALFLVNSSFSLAKCVRDQQEARAAEVHVAPYR
ncbi:YiaA/YiaB family inner membrane protein [Nocardioides stalactiti]|uniref:YiaA/YiaB family inner membrane protein n=1 Tax=Nocardioides stalactiti TaxID=2755356 RepID=UPI001601E0E4|nr:YiaA/YiaB family inner membrane protein [Nocardioides stalactiti]